MYAEFPPQTNFEKLLHVSVWSMHCGVNIHVEQFAKFTS